MRSERKKASRKELAAAIILCVLLGAGAFALRSVSSGGYAVISADSEEIARLPLDKDTVFLPDGYDIEITVSNGAVSVTKSGCRDKICEKTGAIRNSYQSIVCLPQKITVRIDDNTDSEIDVELN